MSTCPNKSYHGKAGKILDGWLCTRNICALMKQCSRMGEIDASHYRSWSHSATTGCPKCQWQFLARSYENCLRPKHATCCSNINQARLVSFQKCLTIDWFIHVVQHPTAMLWLTWIPHCRAGVQEHSCLLSPSECGRCGRLSNPRLHSQQKNATAAD